MSCTSYAPSPTAEWKTKGEAIETVSIHPEAADVRVEKLTLVWVPVA